MAALIEVAYDRQYTDADVQAVAARAAATINVLQRVAQLANAGCRRHKKS